mmetsp:Transcript_48264/g.151391  ORF Transcript_48264/g.151391 Transcript_48264/m.151391 type:complete len:354 (+) Transcript_48264:185-1246(+)
MGLCDEGTHRKMRHLRVIPLIFLLLLHVVVVEAFSLSLGKQSNSTRIFDPFKWFRSLKGSRSGGLELNRANRLAEGLKHSVRFLESIAMKITRIYEYRVTMPLSKEDFDRGKMYAVVKMSEREDDGNGGRVVNILSFGKQVHKLYGVGIHCRKQYNIARRLPKWVQMTISSSIILEEESWHFDHHNLTIVDLRIPKLPGFILHITSVQKEGHGASNAHNLTETLLAKREIVNIDMTDIEQSCLRNTQCKNNSNTNFAKIADSNYSGPLSTSYKVVAVHFPYFGLQDTAESLIKEHQTSLFLKTHKLIMNSWVEWNVLPFSEIEEMFITQAQQQVTTTKHSPADTLRNTSQREI